MILDTNALSALMDGDPGAARSAGLSQDAYSDRAMR